MRWWALEVVVGWRVGAERSGAGAVVPPVVWAACWSGGDGFGSASAVFVDGDAVHREGTADEVEVLSGVSDGVGPPEPEGVVEVAVDGLGVVTSGVEPSEIGICWWDGSDVLGAGHNFVDVAAGWQQSPVGWAASYGITNGISPAEFGPDQTVTRGQAAAFISRFVNGL
ncbi:MAG: S-layer homology domain-containing protein [Acidimicrobiales bacterium]